MIIHVIQFIHVSADWSGNQSLVFCANRMTGRSIDAWSNKRTQDKHKSTRLPTSRVEPDAFWRPISGEYYTCYPPTGAAIMMTINTWLYILLLLLLLILLIVVNTYY